MNIVEQIFKSLDGKKARVTSGGLNAEGSIEGDVKLQYVEYRGLELIGSAKHNDELDIAVKLNDFIGQVREDSKLTYDVADAFRDAASKFIESLSVTIGLVHQYGIKSFDVQVDEKGNVKFLTITYKDSVVNVNVLKS